jgi:hypothetical protein
MSGYTKLEAPIEPDGARELERLARRCGTTAKMLGELAIRQLFIAVRAGDLPSLPPLDPGIAGGLGLWLNEADRAALDDLADGQGTTPARLASLAVRHMLAQARNGALPMLKPLEEAAAPKLMSREQLLFENNRWDAKHLDNPDDLPEEKPLRPARVNFSKALFTIERLERLHVQGIDPANPRAALDDIDALAMVRPPN